MSFVLLRERIGHREYFLCDINDLSTNSRFLAEYRQRSFLVLCRFDMLDDEGELVFERRVV